METGLTQIFINAIVQSAALLAILKTIIKILTTPAPWVHWHVANQWRQHGPVSLCSRGRIYIV